MRKKLNKKKIALVIIISIIIICITYPIFGRYVYNNIRDAYLKSKNFSFTSNFLENTEKTYKYANWSGLETYEIDIQLYSYENELSLFNYDGSGLEYKLSCNIEDPTKAIVHIDDNTNGTSEKTDYIPNATNIKDIKIYLEPKTTLNAGEIITLNITAETTKPYKKKLTAKFQIIVSEQLVSYKIEDEEDSIYATLKLLNAKAEENQITLSFNPEIIGIDTTDETYINKISQTTKKITGSDAQYINSITISIGASESKNIKFYKKDKSQNYTYPNNSGENMIINITD